MPEPVDRDFRGDGDGRGVINSATSGPHERDPENHPDEVETAQYGGRRHRCVVESGHRVPRSARSINWVTAPAWLTMAACEELTSTGCEPARAAMKRSRSGARAWSRVATRYQDGMVFQA